MRNIVEIKDKLRTFNALKQDMYNQITNLNIDLEPLKIRELSNIYNSVSGKIALLEWVLRERAL